MVSFHLEVLPSDIAGAICGNRAQCIIARALRRKLRLDGNAYVNVDGVGVAWTWEGRRFHFAGPRTMVKYLRDFDLIGRARGQAEARARMEPRAFKLTQFIEPTVIPPKASRERMDQINALRNAKAAAAREAGVKPTKPHKRYAGI